MKTSFPVEGVTIKNTSVHREVDAPQFKDALVSLNQSEYSLKVPEVGCFYARDGELVEYSTVPGADPDWVNLYLNGQVLVALLHQRKIINFHASSFIHNDSGIMILGETGAGKSSLTASFALAGAGFLTDDLTPVIFKETCPQLLPLRRAIKVRDNTIGQLNIDTNWLTAAEEGTGKQYLHMEQAAVVDYPLHTILKIEIGNCRKPEFHEPSTSEKFSLVRSEICSWEILAGMPETEKEYLQQLVRIIECAKVVKVVRPPEISIGEMRGEIEGYLQR